MPLTPKGSFLEQMVEENGGELPNPGKRWWWYFIALCYFCIHYIVICIVCVQATTWGFYTVGLISVSNPPFQVKLSFPKTFRKKVIEIAVQVILQADVFST